MKDFNVERVRSHFPALTRQHNGSPIIWACAPGGTQVPASVIDAMVSYQRHGLSNLHGCFSASREANAVVELARSKAALLVGSEDPEEVHFGANATSLIFQLSHALSRTWSAGDVIIVTDLDHDANVRPWLRAAQRVGVEVRTWRLRPEDGALHIEDLAPLLSERVKLLAVTAAANSMGTVMPIEEIVPLMRTIGALVVVDAVHLAPHRLIDVQAMGCDALTCSVYKFFGPHLGVQWIRRDLSECLEVDKVLPAPEEGAARWETGTVNVPALAGLVASIDYLLSLGGSVDRKSLKRGFLAIGAHEERLSERFLQKVKGVSGLKILGEPTAKANKRTPTFAITVPDISSARLAMALGEEGVNAWSGHFYALGVMERLQLSAAGGLLRLGYVHYHTVEEVERTVATLSRVVSSLRQGRSG